MQKFLPILLFPLVIVMIACSPADDSEEGVNIWVTLLPQKSFVEAVAGDSAQVSVMVRSGQSPETYSPSASQMGLLAQSDIYFGIGMPLERNILSRIERSMPRLVFVQTADLIAVPHDHSHDGACLHGDEDPHVWMDPIWMLGFVEQVRVALSDLQPEQAELFAANAALLSQKLRDLDAGLQEKFGPYAGRSFYINHPSLGHFAERYGLVQRSIEVGGSAPSARQVAELVAAAKADQVGAIFTQPEFGRSSADVLARALEVEVVTLDILSEEYFGNMLEIAQRLKDSFKQ
ncbi:MAG: hypothetical protein EA353_04165 [Puniceicoccaceae bacterium]|nr:MAG: hypothetical protein EA353_04165 [Puniceicoccaceae bacterium]